MLDRLLSIFRKKPARHPGGRPRLMAARPLTSTERSRYCRIRRRMRKAIKAAEATLALTEQQRRQAMEVPSPEEVLREANTNRWKQVLCEVPNRLIRLNWFLGRF